MVASHSKGTRDRLRSFEGRIGHSIAFRCGENTFSRRLPHSFLIRSATLSSGRRPHKSCFPVRSASLLSRPDLAVPKPRSATKEMGGAEPPAATRSTPCRARAWRGWRAPDLLRSEHRGPLLTSRRVASPDIYAALGIGGHLATPPLPHHRAYGSVPRRFGGLGFDEVRHGDQAHGTKAALAERLMQGAGRTQTPRSLRAIGRLEGRLLGNPEMTQPSDTPAHCPPLHPGKTSQSPPYPGIKRWKLAPLAEAEIACPSAQDRIQVLDHLGHADASRTPRQFLHPALEPDDRLRCDAATRSLLVPHRETKEGAFPRTTNGTLCRIHLKLQPRLDEAGDARHH